MKNTCLATMPPNKNIHLTGIDGALINKFKGLEMHFKVHGVTSHTLMSSAGTFNSKKKGQGGVCRRAHLILQACAGSIHQVLIIIRG